MLKGNVSSISTIKYVFDKPIFNTLKSVTINNVVCTIFYLVWLVCRKSLEICGPHALRSPGTHLLPWVPMCTTLTAGIFLKVTYFAIWEILKGRMKPVTLHNTDHWAVEMMYWLYAWDLKLLFRIPMFMLCYITIIKYIYYTFSFLIIKIFYLRSGNIHLLWGTFKADFNTRCNY